MALLSDARLAAVRAELDAALADKAALASELRGVRESADRDLSALRAEAAAAAADVRRLSAKLAEAEQRAVEAESRASRAAAGGGGDPAAEGGDGAAAALRQQLDDARAMLLDALSQKRRLTARLTPLRLPFPCASSSPTRHAPRARIAPPDGPPHPAPHDSPSIGIDNAQEELNAAAAALAAAPPAAEVEALRAATADLERRLQEAMAGREARHGRSRSTPRSTRPTGISLLSRRLRESGRLLLR